MTSTNIIIIGIGLLVSFKTHARFFERKIKTIHRERPNYNAPWIKLASEPKEALLRLGSIMAQSPTGKKILAKAEEKSSRDGLNLSQVIFEGEKSYTDIMLVRKFSKHSPSSIQYKTRSRVFINRNLNIRDAVMDMAHELVHYAKREDFNPYRKDFNLQHFILSTIEGKGGEVDAYMVECQVFFELFSRSYPQQNNCRLIQDAQTQKIDRSKATALFYRLGAYYHPFMEKIKRHKVPSTLNRSISSQQNLLVSAAYDLPYPLAAVHEYENIMKKTCENERKRINALPSGEVSLAILESYRDRCSPVLN